MMHSNWLKPNHFVVKDGKIVPRPTTPPNTKKNYRYLPFDPMNRPGPDDYFRETIARLQQENSFLKTKLNTQEHRPAPIHNQESSS